MCVSDGGLCVYVGMNAPCMHAVCAQISWMCVCVCSLAAVCFHAEFLNLSWSWICRMRSMCAWGVCSWSWERVKGKGSVQGKLDGKRIACGIYVVTFWLNVWCVCLRDLQCSGGSFSLRDMDYVNREKKGQIPSSPGCVLFRLGWRGTLVASNSSAVKCKKSFTFSRDTEPTVAFSATLDVPILT